MKLKLKEEKKEASKTLDKLSKFNTTIKSEKEVWKKEQEEKNRKDKLDKEEEIKKLKTKNQKLKKYLNYYEKENEKLKFLNKNLMEKIDKLGKDYQVKKINGFLNEIGIKNDQNNEEKEILKKSFCEDDFVNKSCFEIFSEKMFDNNNNKNSVCLNQKILNNKDFNYRSKSVNVSIKSKQDLQNLNIFEKKSKEYLKEENFQILYRKEIRNDYDLNDFFCYINYKSNKKFIIENLKNYSFNKKQIRPCSKNLLKDYKNYLRKSTSNSIENNHKYKKNKIKFFLEKPEDNWAFSELSPKKNTNEDVNKIINHEKMIIRRFKTYLFKLFDRFNKVFQKDLSELEKKIIKLNKIIKYNFLVIYLFQKKENIFFKSKLNTVQILLKQEKIKYNEIN